MSPASELRQSSCISRYQSQNYRKWACSTSAAGEVDSLDVGGPHSMSQMDSSLKTAYFMLLSFSSLPTSLCNWGCYWRSVSWFTEIRMFLHNCKHIWHSFVMCLCTEAPRTDFPLLSLTLYGVYVQHSTGCWVFPVPNQIQLGSLISDQLSGFTWDMKNEKEISISGLRPEVMQKQTPQRSTV